MEIKKILENTSNFLIKRFIEVIGLIISIFSLLLLVALISYSPEDPNFIFPDNTEIKNILGFRGSFVSDIFFQSLGLISILIAVTLFFTGSNIVRTKKIILILQNIFYLILYSIIGSLFFTIYYPDSFWLAINGNGGFVGRLLSDTFLVSIININKEISYYLLFFSIFIIFFISINLNIYWLFNFLKNIFSKIFSKKEKKYTNESVENELNSITTNYDKPIQENLPFGSSKPEDSSKKIKFKLPSIDFLKSPSKSERSES